MPTINPVNKIRVKGVYYDLIRQVESIDSSLISSMSDDSSLMKVYVDTNEDNVYVASHSNIIKMTSENKTLTEKMMEVPEVKSGVNSDLDISDPQDFVLARFSDGHFQTKEFDSRDINKIKHNTGLTEYEDFDSTKNYAVGDVVLYQGLLYKFMNHHDAGIWNVNEVEPTTITEGIEHPVDVKVSDVYSDLDITDANGNILSRHSEGHFKTKNFDSRDVEKIKLNIGLPEYEVFDKTKSYEIGNIVLYQGLLYKFVSAHAAGDWSGSDVERTTISAGDEHPISVKQGYSLSELDITDEYGFVIAHFGDGHIKTKNFNSSALTNGKQRPTSSFSLSPFGNIYYENFLVDVNVGIENNSDMSANLQDTAADSLNIKKDRCLINFPPNYNENGKPVRLVIANFGSAGRITSTTTKCYHMMPLLTTLLAEGYAVMQVNGTPGETDGIETYGSMGTPQFLLSVIQAYKYVTDKYNIKTDGIFLSGWSQGTLKSWQIATHLKNIIPIRACVNYAICYDLWKTMYAYTPQANREWVCEQFGFKEKVVNNYVLELQELYRQDNSKGLSTQYSEGDIVYKPTSYTGKQELPTDAEFAYILNNYETWIGYDPICYGTSKNIIGKQFIHRSRKGDTNKESECFQDVAISVPCNMKIFMGESDAITPLQIMKNYKIMCENGGQMCHFRVFEGGTHGFPDASVYSSITVQTKYGSQITTNVPSWEGMKFLERYDN